MSNYYEQVRPRIVDFCRGAEYTVGTGRALADEGNARELSLIYSDVPDEFMAKDLAVFRSIQGRDHMLAILDVEYFNLRSMDWILREPHTVFGLMEPARRGLEHEFNRFGINHHVTITPSGYHFESRIPFDSAVFSEMARLGHISDSLYLKCTNRKVDPKQGKASPWTEKAYNTLGNLMNFICFNVMRDVKCELPITISDAAQGGHREGISLDTTQYADPMYMRDIRVPFSRHSKHIRTPGRYGGPDFVRALGPRFSIPMGDLSLDDAIATMASEELAIAHSRDVDTAAPDSGFGWRNALNEYLRTNLRRFHERFDRTDYNHGHWETSYGTFDFNRLPVCVAHAFEDTNDLQKPTQLQAICRALSAGYGDVAPWEPKHIAGLLLYHYSRRVVPTPSPLQPLYWHKYDAATRVDFWVKTYAGMLAQRVDSVKNLSCENRMAEGFCVHAECKDHGFKIKEVRDAD